MIQTVFIPVLEDYAAKFVEKIQIYAIALKLRQKQKKDKRKNQKMEKTHLWKILKKIPLKIWIIS